MKRVDKKNFTEGVLQIVKLIPYGRATSYGAIAKAAGYPNMSRMVGRLMGECPDDENIPAHRVVNSQGLLSGREAFGNNGEMQTLLEQEGVVIKDNKIVNWKKVFWNPIEELAME